MTPTLRRDEDAYVDREYHPSLAAEIRAAGGQWVAGDHHARAAQIVAEASRVGATALRVSLRDLSMLAGVPGLWHLDVESDGSPPIEAIGSLTGLRSVHLSVRGMRGVLDLSTLPALRWLSTPLGGKGGALVLASLAAGHPAIEHLSVREARIRSLGELVPGLPRLRSLSVSRADVVRSPGDLGAVAHTLTELRLSMVPGLRSLDGIETAVRLERLELSSSRLTDLSPLSRLPHLREVDITLAGGVRITDVRDLS